MLALGLSSQTLGGAALSDSDKGLLCAIAEERLTRHKGCTGFAKSLDYVLTACGVSLSDIAATAVDSDKAKDFLISSGYCGEIKVFSDKAYIFAAAAFFASDFDTAVIMVADVDDTAFFKGTKQGIELLYRTKENIGKKYAEATEKLGFDGISEQGKTMALAGTGEDTAFALQSSTEQKLMSEIKQALSMQECHNLAMAGTLGLNCIANGKIYKTMSKQISDFKMFVQPASDNNGQTLGLAYLAAGGFAGKPLTDVYLGRKYKNKEIALSVKEYISQINILAKGRLSVTASCAELLAQGCIIGWFQGQSEFGARALGNRSILSLPSLPKASLRKLKSIKSREEFRPFAPSMPAKYMQDFFITDGMKESPFMLFGLTVKSKYKHILKDVVHQDNTSRIQTVKYRQNPRYYQLLQAVYAKTGVPVLLNTSFNRANEPIVETPKDAIKCFLETDMDFLALGNVLLGKRT